jgi:hypothetical protein
MMSLTQDTNQCAKPNDVDSNNIIQPIERKEVNMNKDMNAEIEIFDSSNDIKENTEQATIALKARDWFTDLTSEERSGATRFTDHAFLGTFLTFASSWSTKTTTAATNNHHVSGTARSTQNLGEYTFLRTFYTKRPGFLRTEDRRTDLTVLRRYPVRNNNVLGYLHLALSMLFQYPLSDVCTPLTASISNDYSLRYNSCNTLGCHDFVERIRKEVSRN